MNPIKCVIFDMDGTLIDSEKIYMECYVRAAKKHGLTVEEEVFHVLIGTSGEDEFRLLDEITNSRPLTMAIYDSMLTLAKATDGAPPLKSGALSLLQKCKTLDLIVVLATSTHKKSAVATLKQLGIFDYFHVLVFGDDVTIPKPHPMMYELAFSLTAVNKKEDVLVFEDSHVGVRAAHEAGFKVAQLVDDVAPYPVADYHLRCLEEGLEMFE